MHFSSENNLYKEVLDDKTSLSLYSQLGLAKKKVGFSEVFFSFYEG
jgi:hypothetical protein